jgi:predicted permease
LDEQSLSFRLRAILFPIFGIVAAGYFYARQHKPEMAVANRLNMDVFVPALVFAAMAGKSFDLAAYAPLALGGFLVLATCGLLAWPIARLVGIQPKTLVPPMMFNNSGNIGLPLAVLAWGEDALPAAVILFMVENTLHFSFGARLLDPGARLLTLWRVPVVAAAIAGLAVALAQDSGVAAAGHRHQDARRRLGAAAAFLARRPNDRCESFREWKVGVGSALLRPLAGMAIAAGVIELLGLQGRDAAMLLVFGACRRPCSTSCLPNATGRSRNVSPRSC